MTDNRQKRYLWVDPPGGWRYGFPKGLPEDFEMSDENLQKFLLENGYPKDEIILASRHSRMGFEYTYEDDDNDK